MLPSCATSHLDVPAVAFDVVARVGGATKSGRAAPGERIEQEFIIEIATREADDPAFRLLWSALVAEGCGSEKIYQTPAYFTFQTEGLTSHRMELLTITRRVDGKLVGVIPVRIGPQTVDFSVGKFSLCKTDVVMIRLLGSIPAAPAGDAMAQYLVQKLLSLFPEARAVFMHAMPRASEQWAALTAPTLGGRPLATSLMGPWRGCHTIPLPDTFAQYLEKFSAKKRYNLNRQIRQLATQAGTLDLLRVDSAEQVPQMMTMLESLLSPAQQSRLMSQASYERLARKDLLLVYLLSAGDALMAAVIATRSPDVVHVHNIFVTPKYHSLSVGTSVVHLAIDDLMSFGCYRLIDFGYGTPNEEFRSSHVIEERAQVVVFNRASVVHLLFAAHSLFHRAVEKVIPMVKKARNAWRKRGAGQG